MKKRTYRNNLDKTHQRLTTLMHKVNDVHENCKVLIGSLVPSAQILNVDVSSYGYCQYGPRDELLLRSFRVLFYSNKEVSTKKASSLCLESPLFCRGISFNQYVITGN